MSWLARRLMPMLAIAIVGSSAAACSSDGSSPGGGGSAHVPPASTAAAPSDSTPARLPTTKPAVRPVRHVRIPNGYDPRRDARADIAAARAASAKDGRPVLLDFGADWCPDCVVLDRLYHQPGAQAILDRSYHLVLVNVGQFDTNLALAAKYVNLRTSGIPALVVLDPHGRIVYASNDGAFADARTMAGHQLTAFLSRWANA